MRALALAAALLLAGTAAAETSGTLTIDLGSSVTLALVPIPKGRFQMGAPASEPHYQGTETLHTVELTEDYYLGETEVTVRQFRRFVDETGYKTLAEREGWAIGWAGEDWGKVPGMNWRKPTIDQPTDNHPVLAVAWEDADAFCRWFGKRSGLRASLPTEAEWERACRGGGQTAYFWGDKVEDGLAYANLSDKATGDRFHWKWAMAGSDGYLFTAPVKSFKPNGYGLYDMAGNAWEWTADWLADYPAGPVTDPVSPAKGEVKVIRGGGWGVPPDWCRCSTRGFHPATDRTIGIGFRVAAYGSEASGATGRNHGKI